MSEIVFSYDTKDPSERERAYKVTSRKELRRLNQIFGLAETVYPALYVDMFGMLTVSDIKNEQFLRNTGYDIIEI